MRPLACGEAAAMDSMPSGQHASDLGGHDVGRAEQLVGDAQPLGTWCTEDAVPIAIDGRRDAACGHHLAQQQQVASGVLLLTEKRRQRLTGGIVHRTQQAPARTVWAQPAVRTTVQLQQHAFGRHALAASAMG